MSVFDDSYMVYEKICLLSVIVAGSATLMVSLYFAVRHLSALGGWAASSFSFTAWFHVMHACFTAWLISGSIILFRWLHCYDTSIDHQTAYEGVCALSSTFSAYSWAYEMVNTSKLFMLVIVVMSWAILMPSRADPDAANDEGGSIAKLEMLGEGLPMPIPAAKPGDSEGEVNGDQQGGDWLDDYTSKVRQSRFQLRAAALIMLCWSGVVVYDLQWWATVIRQRSHQVHKCQRGLDDDDEVQSCYQDQFMKLYTDMTCEAGNVVIVTVIRSIFEIIMVGSFLRLAIWANRSTGTRNLTYYFSFISFCLMLQVSRTLYCLLSTAQGFWCTGLWYGVINIFLGGMLPGWIWCVSAACSTLTQKPPGSRAGAAARAPPLPASKRVACWRTTSATICSGASVSRACTNE